MFKYHFALSSKIFLILISLYFSFALNVKFWSFISENIHIDNLKSAIFALSLPVFIFAALYLFFSLLVWPKIFKPLIIILLILSSCSDYAMYKLGVIIDADMVRNFAETTWREGADFITIRSVLYVLFLGIVPATIILITKIKFNPIKQEIKQRLFYNFIVLAIFAVLIAVSYKEYVSFGRNNRIVRKYINTFNYIYSVGK